MQKSLSIVIPAYNEERHISACLDSIAAQTVKPDEVIVVDNNSTDRTAAIARKYPFVKVLHESKQGLTPARNRGFSAARGEILGRINADAVLGPDWVGRAKEQFGADEKLGGLTGPAFTHLLPYIYGRKVTIVSRLYLRQSEAYFRVRLLWGANMAIRASAWREIQAAACPDDSLVHEDQDLSLLLAAHGWKTRCDNRLLISSEGEHYFDWPKFKEYMQRRWRTKSRHKKLGTLGRPGARVLSPWYCAPVWLGLSGFVGIFAAASFLSWHPRLILNFLKNHSRR